MISIDDITVNMVDILFTDNLTPLALSKEEKIAAALLALEKKVDLIDQNRDYFKSTASKWVDDIAFHLGYINPLNDQSDISQVDKDSVVLHIKKLVHNVISEGLKEFCHECSIELDGSSDESDDDLMSDSDSDDVPSDKENEAIVPAEQSGAGRETTPGNSSGNCSALMTFR